ncbi:MAG: tRNA dihydrouridine synthase DusB [Candidatus Omnitrophota bacterium]
MKLKKFLTTAYPLILAPLSGISSLPFRIVNRSLGCKYAFTEMICARALTYNNKKTLDYFKTVAEDAPLGIQFLGNDPYYLSCAIEKIQGIKFDVLDFNAGCPHKKVTNKGQGAYLLKTPKKLQELLKCLVKNSPVPVTLKMRLGWNNTKSANDLAYLAQDSGVSALFVHGRTQEQVYSGDVNYQSIAGIKKILKIPVIGSGNVLNPQLAEEMFNRTGCDGVLIARGAFGNPWIFKQTKELLTKGKISSFPSVHEVADIMKKHFNLMDELFGTQSAVIRFRKFYAWYTKGVSHTKILRAQMMQAKNKNKILELIEKFSKINNDEYECKRNY